MDKKKRPIKKRKRFRLLKFVIILFIFFLIPLKLGSCAGNSLSKPIYTEKNSFISRFIGRINISKKDNEVISSENAYALDRNNHVVVFKKNETKKAYPASLTKIMTALVALENIDDLSDIAPIDIDSYRLMIENNASMAGFYGKEMVTYRDLLYGTILESGGEAANSLAVNISGNKEDFVELMNIKAKEIGLKDTNFTNPEGLHNDKQYTTAKDMATLIDYALKNIDFRAIFTKKEFTSSKTLDHPEGIKLRSTVLRNIPEGLDFDIIGGKSGTTNEAGQCWATLGIKNGKEYIVVTLNHALENSNQFGHRDDTFEIFNLIN
ncbi:MAG: D-alanyl-D-alanine carboxypeptidase [Clostridium sp.]|nr:D-alanyl-D-alanine carboxypeptidase [Clostridium sp.]